MSEKSHMEVSVSEERRDGRGRWSAKRKTAAASTDTSF